MVVSEGWAERERFEVGCGLQRAVEGVGRRDAIGKRLESRRGGGRVLEAVREGRRKRVEGRSDDDQSEKRLEGAGRGSGTREELAGKAEKGKERN